jgi:predicted ATPase/DNA-binding SARP family transcriptional activator
MAADPLPELSLFFFGAPRIERGGSAIRPDTRKAVALLAYLIMTGQPHTRDALAALLYPEYDESHAKAALRRTLSSLNTTLGQGYIHVAHDLISMETNSPVWADVTEFYHLVEQARNCTHPLHKDTRPPPQDICPVCRPWLKQAVDLYGGNFLAGFSLRDSPGFDDWQFFKGEELRRKLASSLKKLAYRASLDADHEQAIAYARRWLALDPLQEDAHRELMRCYTLAGQRNAALRQYQECVRILEKELGVEPLEETQRLHDDIQHNRLAPLEPVAPPLLPGTPPPAPTSAQTLSQIRFPLVGRSPETENLVHAYHDGAQRGHFVALKGEAGIGKTRLAEEFTAWARQQGAMLLAVRCFEGETSLAYAPFIQALTDGLKEPGARARLDGLADEWLYQARRLLPELRSGGDEILPLDASPGAQSLFFEGLRQVLLRLASSQPPGVLFIDDLHWADPASLDFLAYLVRRLSGNPVFILAAWRDEDLPSQARLRHMLAEAQRAGHATSLRLDRLQPSAVADLARQATEQLEQTLPAGFTDRLYQESEGLPYFLVEYLDALFIDPAGTLQAEAAPTGTSREWDLPDRVRDLLRLRIAQVDELARQLLAAAAVIGRSFEFDTLVAASGRSGYEALTGLETLLAHRLVQECGDCETAGSLRYDFTHDKLRSLVYEETSLTRRRLLHLRVAESLAGGARRSNDPGLVAGSIAYHYCLAGREREAAEYHRQAGEHARRLYANRQALGHYLSALEAGHPDQGALNEAIGDLYTLLGEYTHALEHYAQASVSAASLRDSARLGHRIGAVHQRRGDYAQAIVYFQDSLSNLQAAPAPDSSLDALAARILADWSLANCQQGEMGHALDLAHQAIERAGAANDLRALAQAHNLLGVLDRRGGHLADAQQHLEQSLALAVQLQDEGGQAAALNNLSLLLKEKDNITDGIDYAQKALNICLRLGDRHRLAALHNTLADLYHLASKPEQALDHLKQAVTIFTEIGGSAADIQPEVWKLTEW